jgi:hypothetical protein
MAKVLHILAFQLSLIFRVIGGTQNLSNSCNSNAAHILANTFTPIVKSMDSSISCEMKNSLELQFIADIIGKYIFQVLKLMKIKRRFIKMISFSHTFHEN